jgi:glycosyltransferase involved in cell wall biosynthesis
MSGPAAVSVVVPCYGRGVLLRECLESLLAQGFQDWEAIVVDDGTPSPEVEEVVSELADPRIRYVRHTENRGLSAARNTGYRLANAELILPLDSDDALHPTFLDKTVSACLEDPITDCVYTDFQLFGDAQTVRHNRIRTLEEMLQVQWIPGPGTLQRKHIWENVGGYCEPPLMGEECEWDFWIGACELGLKPVHIPEALYLYRRHAGAMSAGSLMRESEQREAIYRRHRSTFDAFHRGRGFRSAGYLNSATAFLQQGRRVRAIRLALRGLLLEPQNTELRGVLGVAALPAAVVDRIHERNIAKATARLAPSRVSPAEQEKDSWVQRG